MFDYNCDVAQGYGLYTKNDAEYEMAKYASTINVAAGFHAGDPVSIAKAFSFASDNNIALAAHIGYPDIQGYGTRRMDLSEDELKSVVIYQVGALIAFSNTYGLEIETVRCHGALKDELNNSETSALAIAEAIKKINPWLNLVVQNQNTKDLIQSSGLKSALEFEFVSDGSIAQIEQMQKDTGIKIDTIHFSTLDDIKRAYGEAKPAPINYNRVEAQI